jgi:tetratricopeptide (TPR) repeat protein
MFQQASEQYQAADRENPSEENLFGAGYELILGGSPQDSARVFQDGLKRYPNSIRILIGAGTAEFLRGNTSEGIRYLLRATDLAPSDPRAYAFLASAAGIQETEKVRASFKRFLDAAPNSADANYDYAMSLWSGRQDGAVPGETDNVAALLERAIQIKPDFALAHFQLGTLFFDRQDYAGAVLEYEATLHLTPGMKEAHYRLARAYKYTGQTELAAREMRFFEQARNEATPNPGAHPISIDQFVSVIASTTDRESSRLSCPEVHTE